MHKRQVVLVFVVLLSVAISPSSDEKYTLDVGPVTPIVLPTRPAIPKIDFPNKVPPEYYKKLGVYDHVREIKTKKKVVYLTFDDTGSAEQVAKLLNTLKKHKVKAVFFINANLVLRARYLVKRMVKDGHIVANHTYRHSYSRMNNILKARQEIVMMEKLLIQNGIKPRPYFRFPGGFYDNPRMRLIRSLGYTSFYWTFDSMGYKNRSSSNIARRFASELKPGMISLMHLHSNEDINSIPAIVKLVKSRGYTFGLL